MEAMIGHEDGGLIYSSHMPLWCPFLTTSLTYMSLKYRWLAEKNDHIRSTIFTMSEFSLALIVNVWRHLQQPLDFKGGIIFKNKNIRSP